MTPRGGGVEISFVFFIDIIMAVTGVMLLVIILLVLDLDQGRKEAKKEPPAPAPIASVEPVARIEVPTLKPDESAMTREIMALRERIRNSEAELQQLEASIAQAEKKTNSARDEVGELSKLSGLKWKHVELSLADVKVADRKVLLIEFSSNVILLQPIERDVRPVLCKGESMGERVNNLMETLKTYPIDRFAIVLLVKPSAFGESNDLMKLLREKDYAVGSEPLEEDRSAIKW